MQNIVLYSSIYNCSSIKSHRRGVKSIWTGGKDMEPKRLCKSKTNRMIAGVCGGIGEYLNIDPTVIRLIMVLLGFTGTGIVAYIVAAIIMPEPYQ